MIKGKLLTEEITDFRYITEDIEGGGKNLYIEGIFLQSNVKNRNKRVYSKNIMEREVNKYTTQWVDKNRAYGEFGHPDNPQINMDRISHRIVSLKEDGDNWIGKAIIIPEGKGKIAHGIIRTGGTLGVSSRGIGTWKIIEDTKYINDDYRLMTAADIVADPSAPDAFTTSLMEQQEWILDAANGNWQLVEESIKMIRGAKKKDLEKTLLRAFEHFINEI
jgi:hypothetical protein